jgi:hypothetical protein
MNENVLLIVVTVDEAIAAFDVEPFHSTSNFAGDDFLFYR